MEAAVVRKICKLSKAEATIWYLRSLLRVRSRDLGFTETLHSVSNSTHAIYR